MHPESSNNQATMKDQQQQQQTMNMNHSLMSMDQLNPHTSQQPPFAHRSPISQPSNPVDFWVPMNRSDGMWPQPLLFPNPDLNPVAVNPRPWQYPHPPQQPPSTHGPPISEPSNPFDFWVSMNRGHGMWSQPPQFPNPNFNPHVRTEYQNRLKLKMDHQQSIVNQTDVSLSLAKHVISAHAKDKNLVISPLSIHVVLSLIAAGSNGPTQDQLLTFLNSKSTEQLDSFFSDIVSDVLADGSPFGGPRLSSANGAWVEQSYPLKSSFQQIVENAYKAVIRDADFKNKPEEGRKEVNMWAEKETNGLIKEILPRGSVDETTMLVLANAVYFKGIWDQEFDGSFTKDQEFFLLNGSSVQAPFMTNFKKQYVCAFDGFKVLRLPYKQGEDRREFSMYIYLPDAKDGLPSLIEKVSSKSGFIERHRPNQQVQVGDFRIPKFKIAFGFEASEVLKGQGLELPFNPGGLTEMVDDSIAGRFLYVSKIYHKSFIEVNEEGTEAAAVTVAAMGFGCALRQFEVKLDFVADHPFLFVIREDTTGVVLFIGQVLNPLAG